MKYKYHMEDLDCAACANKIEETLKKDSQLKDVHVNFSNLTLSFETEKKGDVKAYVEKLIRKVEPEVRIYPITFKKEEKKKETILEVVRLTLGVLLAVFGNVLSIKVLIFLGFVLLLFRTFKKAMELLISSKSIDENLLITVSCLGAFFTNNVMEGVMVILLYGIGKILENLAVNRSRNSVASLIELRPNSANVKTKEGIKTVSPESVYIGDVLVIKSGERIPLDGIVVEGSSFLDTSMLTGESVPRKVTVNDNVLSGSINKGNLLLIKVTEKYENSTISRILDLVENATDKKTKTENFVSRFSKIYTPVILLLALISCILLHFLFSLSFQESLYRSLVFLVVSCPCAIAISVPLSYFSGIGKCSSEGILVKGSNYLDALVDIKRIIFDKTGTLTTGEFTDYQLNLLSSNYTEEEVISYFLKGESLSTHPIAKSICNLFSTPFSTKEVKCFKEHAGKGITYEEKNKKVAIGNNKLFKVRNSDENAIYLKIDNEIVASLSIHDGLKANAKKVISQLKEMGITCEMFTGDHKEYATLIAEQLDIEQTSELLPEDKYHLLEKRMEEKEGNVAFVGDGINDAPSLALSDIGISMGGVGSAQAIESSDIVIMNDDIASILTGISIAKKTNRILKENLCFALFTKFFILLASFFGYASMWMAVFADTGVTLLTILNTTRILKTYIK